MSLQGTCHGCGRTGTLFDVESSGTKFCRECVAMMTAFPGQIVRPRPAAREERTGGHMGVHAMPGFPWCPECRAIWRARV